MSPFPTRVAPRGLLGLWLALQAAGCSSSSIDNWFTDLKSSEMDVRRKAVQQLAENAREDKRIPEALLGLLDDFDPEVRRWSCRGLERSQTLAAKGPLERRMGDADMSVRRAAAFALLRIAPDSPLARREFEQAMRSGDGGVISALTNWSPPPTWAVDTAIALLKDRRAGIRRLSAEALGAWGAGSAKAAAALRRAQSDADEDVRVAVEHALETLQR